jgi:hypothetical protein
VPSCETDANCDAGSGRPYCDTDRNICVECLGDGNCADTDDPICLEGRCVECVDDSTCGGDDPYCRTENHRCVECLTDANCDQDEFCDNDFSCQSP